MAIRQMWSFDYLPAGLDLSLANAIPFYTNIDPATALQFPGASSAANLGANITTDGWLSLTNYKLGTTTYSNLSPALTATKANLLPAATGNAYVGFRTRIPTGNAQPGAPGPVMFMSVGANGATTLIPITETNMTAWGANVVGKEYYVEILFLRSGTVASQSYTVWIDGVLKATVPGGFPVAWSGFVFLWFGRYNLGSDNGAAPNARDYRDIYFVEDTGDSLPTSTRLGPMRSSFSPIASVTAPNYTLAAGSTGVVTPIASLNFPLQNPPAATPLLTNAASLDPMTMTPGAAIPTGANILAVQPVAGIGSPGSGVGKLLASLNQTGGNQALATSTFTDANMRYAQSLGILPLDASGAVWTQAKINAASLVLTPST